MKNDSSGLWRRSPLRVSRCFGLGATRHFPDECLETRIAAQRFESSVDLDAAVDPGVERREIFVALFQQPQRFLFIPQRQVDDSERIGWDITLPGCSRQLVEYLSRLFFPSRQSVGPGKRSLNSRIGIELRGFLILRDRFRELALVLIGLSEKPVREIERWVDLDRLRNCSIASSFRPAAAKVEPRTELMTRDSGSSSCARLISARASSNRPSFWSSSPYQ